MNKTHIINVIALIAAAFAGSVLLPNIAYKAHADTIGHQKHYLVHAGFGQDNIEPELNKQAALGWKFEQAVSEGSTGVDLIFSKGE